MKVKSLMMAAVAAASTMMVGATPRTAAAWTAVASVAAMAADMLYPVYDGGKLIGYFDGRTGQWVPAESSGPQL